MPGGGDLALRCASGGRVAREIAGAAHPRSESFHAHGLEVASQVIGEAGPIAAKFNFGSNVSIGVVGVASGDGATARCSGLAGATIFHVAELCLKLIGSARTQWVHHSGRRARPVVRVAQREFFDATCMFCTNTAPATVELECRKASSVLICNSSQRLWQVRAARMRALVVRI